MSFTPEQLEELRALAAALTPPTQNGVFNGMPQWVKVITYLGLLPALVVWLMWVFVGDIKALGPVLATHVETSNQHHTEFHEASESHEKSEAIMKAILAQICANGAGNRAERDKCFPEGVK